MNVKRILIIASVVFIVCLLFAGAASAFTVTQKAVSNPSGALVSGVNVNTKLAITLVADEMDVESSLDFASDLDNPSITVEICRVKGQSYITTVKPSATGNSISGYDLSGYGADLLLNIEVNGLVPTLTEEKTIIPITVSVNSKKPSGTSTYSAPSQMVYISKNLDAHLQTLNNGITFLEPILNEYITAGYDCSDAQKNLNTARTKYQAANAAGTNRDYLTAFTNYDEGMAELYEAQTFLTTVALTDISGYTDAIDKIIAGKDDAKALNIGSRNSLIIMESRTLKAECEAGTYNIEKVNELHADAVSLYNDTIKYSEGSSLNPGEIFGSPVFVIIIVAVAVIAIGVVVFFIIRRRNNSWDELG